MNDPKTNGEPMKMSSKIPPDLQEKVGERSVYYLGRKYLLIKSDTLNHAILLKSKLKKSTNVSDAVIGYHGSLSIALEELIKLKSEDTLLDQININGPFNNLQNFVNEYVKSTITVTKAAIESLENE